MSVFLWVRYVLQPSFVHTSKCITSKKVLPLPVCVGERLFPWKTRKERRRKKLKYKKKKKIVAWVRDVFVTSTWITFGYYFCFSDNPKFHNFMFLFASQTWSYSEPGKNIISDNKFFLWNGRFTLYIENHWTMCFLKVIIRTLEDIVWVLYGGNCSKP